MADMGEVLMSTPNSLATAAAFTPAHRAMPIFPWDTGHSKVAPPGSLIFMRPSMPARLHCSIISLTALSALTGTSLTLARILPGRPLRALEILVTLREQKTFMGSMDEPEYAMRSVNPRGTFSFVSTTPA